MAKSIPSSGAGAVRIILKNKDAFHFDLREKKEDNIFRKNEIKIWRYQNGRFGIDSSCHCWDWDLSSSNCDCMCPEKNK